MVMLASLAVNTGAHRLWAHGSYKASAGLRVALMLAQTTVGQVGHRRTKFQGIAV